MLETCDPHSTVSHPAPDIIPITVSNPAHSTTPDVP